MASKNKKNYPPELSPSEQALWDAFAKMVRPLKKQKTVDYTPPCLSYQPKPASVPDMPFLVTHSHKATMATQDLPDLRLLCHRRLKKPKTIHGRLDLHGLNQEQAYAELVQFISRRRMQGQDTLLVITGKGLLRGTEYQGGVLSAALPHWLNNMPLRGYIRTFTHAQPKDGGTGAYYIFLKRFP